MGVDAINKLQFLSFITFKRGKVLLTLPIFVCTTVNLGKILPQHAAGWDNNIDDGPLFFSPSTVDASAAIH